MYSSFSIKKTNFETDSKFKFTALKSVSLCKIENVIFVLYYEYKVYDFFRPGVLCELMITLRAKKLCFLF